MSNIEFLRAVTRRIQVPPTVVATALILFLVQSVKAQSKPPTCTVVDFRIGRLLDGHTTLYFTCKGKLEGAPKHIVLIDEKTKEAAPIDASLKNEKLIAQKPTKEKKGGGSPKGEKSETPPQTNSYILEYDVTANLRAISVLHIADATGTFNQFPIQGFVQATAKEVSAKATKSGENNNTDSAVLDPADRKKYERWCGNRSHLIVLQSPLWYSLDKVNPKSPYEDIDFDVAASNGKGEAKGKSSLHTGRWIALEIGDSYQNFSSMGRGIACVPLSAQDKIVTFNYFSSITKFDPGVGKGPKVEIKGELPTEKNDLKTSLTFNGQAGEGQKPGYMIDGTFNASLELGKTRIFFRPLAQADLGYGSSDNAKKTDALKGGLTFSYGIFPIWTVITAGATFETDRSGVHRNLLGETKINFQHKLLNHLNTDGTWGWKLDSSLWSETGASVDTTVKSSAGAISTTVLPYSIARLSPLTTLDVEMGKHLKIVFTTTPRYVFLIEEHVVLATIALNGLPLPAYVQQPIIGWEIFNQGTITYEIAKKGRFSVSANVTYKQGPQPPNFNDVNVANTGLAINFGQTKE